MPLLPKNVYVMPIMPFQASGASCVHHQYSAAATWINNCISAGCCVKMQKMNPIYLQGITLVGMYTAASLHAHPLERVHLLLPFFLGAAEIASGVSGL